MLKRRLRRWPALYAHLQGGYYAVWYWIERRVLGSRLHEFLWRYRRFDHFAIGDGVHPHRRFLAKRLAALNATSLVEVGCSAGANLAVIARAIPGIRLHGIDVNRRAIEHVRQYAGRGALPHTTASVGRAHDLREFADRSFDVVLADATLMYVGPDKIHAALAEMVRVARNAVVVNDWHLHVAQPGELSRWYDAHWVHDYVALLRSQPSVRSVRVDRFPAGMWSGGGWEEYGALIEADVATGDLSPV